MVGRDGQAEKCPGSKGIKREPDEFVAKEAPSTDVLDMFLTGAVRAPSTTRLRRTRADHDGEGAWRDRRRQAARRETSRTRNPRSRRFTTISEQLAARSRNA